MELPEGVAETFEDNNPIAIARSEANTTNQQLAEAGRWQRNEAGEVELLAANNLETQESLCLAQKASLAQ